jgi:hypothetical protein
MAIVRDLSGNTNHLDEHIPTPGGGGGGGGGGDASAANQVTEIQRLQDIEDKVDLVYASIGATDAIGDPSDDDVTLVGMARFTATKTDAFVTDYLTNNTAATVAMDTSVVRIAGVDYTPKFAVISATTAGDTLIVAAVTGKKLRVLDYVITDGAAVTMKFRSGTTDITGPLTKGAAPGFSANGHFETAAGAILNINLSTNATVGGHIVYIEV